LFHHLLFFKGIYEPAPGTKQAKSKLKIALKNANEQSQVRFLLKNSFNIYNRLIKERSSFQQNTQAPPSESDEPIYSGKSIYGRAPSQCSSVSATQSFDMRMYGRIPQPSHHPQQQQNQQKPNAFGTLQKNEKLENPYYYYGSTRNQKKNKQQVTL